MTQIYAFGLGITTTSTSGEVLDCFFPVPFKSPDKELADAIAGCFPAGFSDVSAQTVQKFAEQSVDGSVRARLLGLCESEQNLVAVRLDRDEAVDSTAAAYLKLHLLSHRLTLPNSQNLEQIFAHLPNVAWTSDGPLAVEELPDALLKARTSGSNLEVLAVDKFPRMTNYVVPAGVRIADASRIRLGAYLGEGTTVMHEGFINFNAGAIGPNMVEGRISQGVILGAHSDLGGSSSTMGTLSGGGEITISIGENCLVGANAGTGIPLGDRCTIEAGLYITAGTPIMVIDEQGDDVGRVKGRELAGASDMLFIRNGANGRIECRTNRKAIALNAQLHAHN
jgi:2,3,4,5-tetrahydropyridine-2-carboxylate N-succinyltransferase